MEKKLIYILNHYSDNSAQHFYHVINLLEEIASHGVEIALIIEKSENEPKIHSERIHVYTQKEKKLKRIPELYKILKKLIKSGYSKIFVRISWIAALVACRCAHKHDAEVYYWNSGDAFEFYRSWTLFAKLKWYITSYSRFYLTQKTVDYFVTGPEYMVNYYVKSAKVKKEKIRLLYNDIDIERFNVVDENEKKILRQKLGLDSEKKYILQVHRFSNYRRTGYYIPDIMKFARNRKDVVLLIIGTGPEEELVRQQIQQAGFENIQMLGSKPNAIIQEYYKACDVFINPSYSEGFPRVLLEAMACGKPIVATAAGGTRDLFETVQSEYIVDINDKENFRKKLEEMIDNKNLQQRCGIENRERVHRYSTENVAKMYINVIWP